MKKIGKLLKNKKGFTLIELIVVIAVLGMIAAIAVPKITGITKNAKETADNQTLLTLNRAIDMYKAQTGDDDLSEIGSASEDAAGAKTVIDNLLKTYNIGVNGEPVAVTDGSGEYGPYVDVDSLSSGSKDGSNNTTVNLYLLPSGKEITWTVPGSKSGDQNGKFDD